MSDPKRGFFVEQRNKKYVDALIKYILTGGKMKKFVKKMLKFLLYFAGFFLAVLIALYFCRNIILDFAIEKGGTAVNGAKVDVYGVNLDVFSQKIAWDKIEAADRNNPWINILETGHTEFQVNLMPLTAGKVIIDSMTVSDIKTGTKRSSSGEIPETDEKKDSKDSSWIKDFALEQLEKEKESIPVLNREFLKDFSSADKIVEELDLITPKKVDEAKAYFEERRVFWKDHLASRDYEQRANEIEKLFVEIKDSENKRPEEILKSIEKIQDLKEKCDSFKKDLKEDREIARSDFAKISQYKNDFPIWVQSDYEKAKKAVSIKDKGLEKISEMLFGKRLTSYSKKIFEIVSQIRNAAGKTVEKETSEKVKTDKYPDLPRFWIKNSKVSISSPDGLYEFNGNISDITSDQNKTNRPVTFGLDHNDEKTGSVSFKGIIDFRDLNEIINFDLQCQNFVLKNLRLTSDDLIPLVIKSGKSDIKASFVSRPKFIEFFGDIKIKDQIFDKKGPGENNSKLESLIFEAVETADKIDISVFVKLDDDKKKISLKSSLGQVIGRKIRDHINDKAAAESKRVEEKVKALIDEKQKEFNLSSGESESLVSDNLSFYESRIEKEEKRLDRQKEDLEKKVKRKIDDKKDELLEKLKIKL